MLHSNNFSHRPYRPSCPASTQAYPQGLEIFDKLANLLDRHKLHSTTVINSRGLDAPLLGPCYASKGMGNWSQELMCEEFIWMAA
jgi:hypothetical protein